MWQKMKTEHKLYAIRRTNNQDFTMKDSLVEQELKKPISSLRERIKLNIYSGLKGTLGTLSKKEAVKNMRQSTGKFLFK